MGRLRAPADTVNINRSLGRIWIGTKADCIDAGGNEDTFRTYQAADSINGLSVIQRDDVKLIEYAKEVAAHVDCTTVRDGPSWCGLVRQPTTGMTYCLADG